MRLLQLAAVALHGVHFAAQVLVEHLRPLLVLASPRLQHLPRRLVTTNVTAPQPKPEGLSSQARDAHCTRRQRSYKLAQGKRAQEGDETLRAWGSRGKVLPAHGRREGQQSAVKQGRSSTQTPSPALLLLLLRPCLPAECHECREGG